MLDLVQARTSILEEIRTWEFDRTIIFHLSTILEALECRGTLEMTICHRKTLYARSKPTIWLWLGINESSVDVVLVPKEGVRLETLEHAYEQALTAFSQNTLSDAQVKRAITLLKSYDVYGRDDPFVAAYHFGKFMVAGGKAKAFDDWLTEIEKVTAEDVLNVANKYLQVDHSTTGLLVQNDNQF